LLNTAIDSDDGNPQLREKARRALSSWLDRLRTVIEEGQRRGEIRSNIDSAELTTLIVSTLEGSLMVSRLQRSDDSRGWTCRHLEEYLETKVRAARQKKLGETQ
jgi:TetR/AcrR family transcriptional repressor of nem operon